MLVEHTRYRQIQLINSQSKEFYSDYFGVYLANYIKEKNRQDKKINIILILFLLSILVAAFCISRPIFAKSDPPPNARIIAQDVVYIKKNFEENIKNKYSGSYVSFPTDGVAHIKKIKYINSKPIRINIVELNTKVNPNLKIKPQIAADKLNHKSTVRRIAQKENSIIAVNGGFFKPQTGVPLGALMIDREVLTGPIYNRVGIAIFEENNETYFKMLNIDFDIKAITKNYSIKLDNINQPRMLSTNTLLYTSNWGKISPPPPKDGYNLLIRGNKAEKISSNPIEIEENTYVISGSRETITKLKKENEIYIDIKLQKEIQNAKHIIGAGPYLVKDSQIYVDYKTQKLQAISGKNPRSAIGFKNDGTFIMVTVDGREQNSVGMTLYELATLMKNIGCEYAMNFDGGSSSAMYIKGKIVNNAINKEGIAVSNALTVIENNSENIQLSSL